jgi:hypothetical protein
MKPISATGFINSEIILDAAVLSRTFLNCSILTVDTWFCTGDNWSVGNVENQQSLSGSVLTLSSAVDRAPELGVGFAARITCDLSA